MQLRQLNNVGVLHSDIPTIANYVKGNFFLLPTFIPLRDLTK